MKNSCIPYEEMKRQYMTGWQTWNVNSVLSYVYMPQGLALNLCVKEYQNGAYLRHPLIGRQNPGDEQIYPLAHGGDYTLVRVCWRSIEFTVETASQGDQLVMLVSASATQPHPAMLVLETGFLWNRPGEIAGSDAQSLNAVTGDKVFSIRAVGTPAAEDPNLPCMGRWLALSLGKNAVFCVGEALSAEQAQAFLQQKRAAYRARLQKIGRDEADLYEALMCAMNWDTVYDARNGRVISPVSRLWSVGAGGYVLFCWDNYFAGLMAALFDKRLAYSNLLEITAERTEAGFVPNLTYGTGQQSLDRSQPPVGSAMALGVYRITGEKWPLEQMYPDLLAWNEWFFSHRMHPSGALGWGSDPFKPRYGNSWETDGVNDRFGASLESGLDNSPMYDDIPFDKERHMLCLEDVGLTGLFILDCRALEQIAEIIGRKEDLPLIFRRKEKAEQGMEGLWNEEKGFYMNRRTDSGEFSPVLSPTHFYALFSRNVPAERAKKIEQYYFDPSFFYGEWVMPSVMRCHPAYPEQDYWRGRIWAPMNFLVYLAAQGHPLEAMRRDLAEKSKKLLLKEWLEKKHIHENYSALTGEGCDKKNSDRFYHWGALLAVIWLMECGRVPPIME